MRRRFPLAGLLAALTACDMPESGHDQVESCPAGTFRDDAGACVPDGCDPRAAPAGDAEVAEGESIQRAADSLGHGVLALTSGTWTENVVLTNAHDGLTIVGRCAALTILDGSGGDDESATVDITARNHQDFGLASLTITGGQRTGVDVAASTLTLENVAITENHELGLHATEGAAVVLRDVDISHQLANSRHAYGEGASFSGATLDAERVTFDDNRLAGLSLDQTEARLVDVSATGTHGPSAPQDGMGIAVFGGHVTLAGVQLNGNDCAGLLVTEGGRVEGARLTAVGNAGYGMVAKDDGTVLSLTETIILDTTTLADGVAGIGIGAADNAELSLTDSVVGGSALDGLVAADGVALTVVRSEIAGAGLSAPNAGLGVQVGANSTATLSEVWIHDVVGYGVRVLAGGAASIVDSRIVDNAGTGIAVSEPSSVVDVVGGEISRTRNESDNAVGTAVQVSNGGTFSGASLSLNDNAGIGIAAFNHGTRVSLIDSSIRHTGAGLSGLGAGAVRLEDGAQATLERVLLRDNLVVGIGVQDFGTMVTLENVFVGGTRTGPDYVAGEGILVGKGATVTGRGVVLDDNRVAGVGVSGGTVQFEDCLVTGTRPDDRSPGGGGVTVQAGGVVRLARCTLRGNEYLSVDVAGAGSTLELSDVSVLKPLPYSALNIAVGAITSGGASLDWIGGVIDDVPGAAVLATGVGTTATLADLRIVGTHPATSDIGVAMEISAGATLVATGLDVHDTQGSIAAISGEGSLATITDSAFSRTSACAAYGDALGIIAHSGGRAELSDVAFVENDGPALIGGTGGDVSCTRCSIAGSTFAGAAVSGGKLVLNASSITDTRPDHSFGGGVGIYARGGEGVTQLSLLDTTIATSPVVGLWLDGADAVSLDNCDIAGGPQVQLRDDLFVLGNAIFARGVPIWDGVRGLRVSDSRLWGAADAAVLLDASSAAFGSLQWEGNGIDVVQQRCEGVDPPTGLDGAVANLCQSSERPVLPLYYDTFLTEAIPLSE